MDLTFDPLTDDLAAIGRRLYHQLAPEPALLVMWLVLAVLLAVFEPEGWGQTVRLTGVPAPAFWLGMPVPRDAE